jgi:FKBP-type peptidyl-prolyl cis-trans isomerase FkpA
MSVAAERALALDRVAALERALALDRLAALGGLTASPRLTARFELTALFKPSVLLSVGLLLSVTGCAGGSGPDADLALPPSDPALLFFAPELEIDLSQFVKTSSGLYIQDVEVGDGPIARRTSRVWIHYVGWLPDGTVFDASMGGDPFHLRLGEREVIRGWSEGISGMRRGGIRRIVVRPGLAYGSSRRGDIPPGATLVFRLELVDVD